MKYINLVTREVVNAQPTPVDGWSTLVVKDMALSDPAYYESTDDYYDVDGPTAVTRHVKVPHVFMPARQATVDVGTTVSPDIQRTSDWTQDQWIAAGFMLYARKDPDNVTEYTVFSVKNETTYPTHVEWTYYEKKHPDTIRAAACKALEAQYHIDLDSNISYMGQTWRGDKDNRDLIAGIISAGMVPPGFYFRCIENINVPMTFAELQGLSQALVARGMGLFAQLQIDKAALP